MDLSLTAFIVLGLSAFLSGISKTGIPGVSILGVVFVPLIMPAKISTGYILPFLIVADLFAVLYWRRSAVWSLILRILPAMIIGVFIGYLLMDRIDNDVYGRVLGTLIILMVVMDWARQRFEIPFPKDSNIFAGFMGIVAGALTMLANAAGPAITVYLLAMRVSKEKFLGTCAWLFFIINLSKVPFSINLNLISLDSLKVNLMLIPCVVIGAFLGIYLVKKISGQNFNTLMRVLTLIGGVKLLF